MTKSVIVTFHSNGNIGCEERYLTEDEEQLPLVAGETRLRRTKRLSGIVEFERNEKGNMALRSPDTYEYDICDMCLVLMTMYKNDCTEGDMIWSIKQRT